MLIHTTALSGSVVPFEVVELMLAVLEVELAAAGAMANGESSEDEEAL